MKTEGIRNNRIPLRRHSSLPIPSSLLFSPNPFFPSNIWYQTSGRCDALECRVDESEQKTEACLISLEMDHDEIEGWKPIMEKRLENLALEVQRANRFMERKTFGHDSTQPGLLHQFESALGRVPVGI